jgi:hypothetical protein
MDIFEQSIKQFLHTFEGLKELQNYYNNHKLLLSGYTFQEVCQWYIGEKAYELERKYAEAERTWLRDQEIM